jgi:tryptophan 2,3-dioxygenase
VGEGEGAGRERRFGQLTEPSGDLLTYGSYLKIPELLSLQQLRSDPPVHDELLFIVVHQAYELWFKQLLFELESVRDRMFVGDAERARHYLVRVHAIERVLIEHIQVLQSMSPQDFLAFRALLTPASGFQSVQFRELEFISGLKRSATCRTWPRRSGSALASNDGGPSPRCGTGSARSWRRAATRCRTTMPASA